MYASHFCYYNVRTRSEEISVICFHVQNFRITGLSTQNVLWQSEKSGILSLLKPNIPRVKISKQSLKYSNGTSFLTFQTNFLIFFLFSRTDEMVPEKSGFQFLITDTCTFIYNRNSSGNIYLSR